MNIKKFSLPKKSEAKRGVASLYVVIFATILFGIVTLSFMRIILSEAEQSSNDDLSRSAYDAAMAGVEDAKRAVNKYYRCLSTGNTSRCESDLVFQDNCNNTIGIAEYLHINNYTINQEFGGVLLQESGGGGGSTFADQAYTCVIVSDTVPDYRGTLTKETRTRVVPLNIAGASATTSATNKINTVKRISFQWYSQLDLGKIGTAHIDNGGKLATQSQKPTPPTIALSFILVRKDANRLDDLYQANNTDEVVYSTKVLVPSNGGAANTTINWGELKQSGNVKLDDKDQHKTVEVGVDTTKEFACQYSFNIDTANITKDDNLVLVASLPYDAEGTDFAVTMYDGLDPATAKPVNFTGSQISVDSTGRTNQLFRRVEVRLDPADLFFPYPQYEVDLQDNGGGDVFKKDFWITANCWYSQKDTGWQEDMCKNNNNT